MAVELGWTRADIRAAAERPEFFEAVALALEARHLAPIIDNLDVRPKKGMDARQRAIVARARAQRGALIRRLRADTPPAPPADQPEAPTDV